MDSLYLLIPLAVILVGLAVCALFWAVRSGQYDDLDMDGRRILFDDQDHPPVDTKNRDVEQQGTRGQRGE